MKLIENVKWDDLNDYIETNIFCAKFNKQGKNLFAVGSSNTNNVKVYNLDNKNKMYTNLKYLDKPIFTIDFSNNGDLLAYSGSESNINIINL